MQLLLMRGVLRWYYMVRSRYAAWRYFRKYGISIDEAVMEYGKYVLIVESQHAKQ